MVSSGLVSRRWARQARQCEDWKGVDWSGRYGGDGYGKLWLVEAGAGWLGSVRKGWAGQVGSGK